MVIETPKWGKRVAKSCLTMVKIKIEYLKDNGIGPIVYQYDRGGSDLIRGTPPKGMCNGWYND